MVTEDPHLTDDAPVGRFSEIICVSQNTLSIFFFISISICETVRKGAKYNIAARGLDAYIRRIGLCGREGNDPLPRYTMFVLHPGTQSLTFAGTHLSYIPEGRMNESGWDSNPGFLLEVGLHIISINIINPSNHSLS